MAVPALAVATAAGGFLIPAPQVHACKHGEQGAESKNAVEVVEGHESEFKKRYRDRRSP